MGVQDLKKLPSVDQILSRNEITRLLSRFPRKLVLLCLNDVLEETRKTVAASRETVPSREEIISGLIGDIERALARKSQSTLKTVVNATGIIIHTNLGRSLLPDACMEALSRAGASYLTLEYDIEKGKRGSRYVHCEEILKELTGCESALVVNNNAAAVLLAMNTLSSGREAIVSRGELVEIGGSFRMPDVMEKSRAVMVEVGTTNRTRISDYEKAITGDTGLLVKVHRSNFRIIGFEEEAGLEELAALGRNHEIPLLHDVGSGLLVDLSPYGLRDEPLVTNSVKAGVDITTFSGDKLLGGPQAGIIIGKKHILDRVRKNPLTRALRVDKLTIAALEAVLKLYYDPEKVLGTIPTISMITTGVDELRTRARRLIDRLGADHSRFLEIAEGQSMIGGGSFPGVTLTTIEVRIRREDMTANQIESLARTYDPPILGRIHDDMFVMDMRTVAADDEDHLINFLIGILGG